MIKILIIEDNAAYRKGICCAIEQTEDMQLCSQFGTAAVALNAIPKFAEVDIPNLILLDLNLPGTSGLDALPKLKKILPEAKVIVLTQSDKEQDVLQAIKGGASGYLLKSSSLPQLIDGIQTVHQGGASLDPSLANLIMDFVRHPPKETPAPNPLSKREREVLTLIADGSAQKQIADQLSISPYTVSEYIANIYKKLNVPNAPAAISKAYQSGILPHDTP